MSIYLPAVYKVKGDVPAVGGVRCAVTISYLLEGSATPVGERVLDYTILNGEYVKYDPSNPYSDADYAQGIKDVLDDKTVQILDKLGLLDFVNMFYNFFRQLITVLRNIVGLFK